jgi:hypothetical protein
MTDDSEEGSEDGTMENDSVEKDDGGEGSSTAATTPPAPEGVIPREDTKDAGEVVEDDEFSEAGESDIRPETSEGEVWFSLPI